MRQRKLPHLRSTWRRPQCRGHRDVLLNVVVTGTEHDPQQPPDEHVLSWITTLTQIAPRDHWVDLCHDDEEAMDLHRLRGLALSQASEMEAALAQVLEVLDPSASRDRPAGALLDSAKGLMSEELKTDLAGSLQLLDHAILRRNRLAHDRINIGSSWQAGQYVPVIALLGAAETSAEDLGEELGLQQQGTLAAVMLLLAVDEWRRSETEQ